MNNFFLGFGRLWVVDGQWKLMFSHCMMQRKVCLYHNLYISIASVYNIPFAPVIFCNFYQPITKPNNNIFLNSSVFYCIFIVFYKVTLYSVIQSIENKLSLYKLL